MKDNLVNQHIVLQNTLHTIIFGIKTAIIGYLVINMPNDPINYIIISNYIWWFVIITSIISSYNFLKYLRGVINLTRVNIETFDEISKNNYKKDVAEKILEKESTRLSNIYEYCTKHLLYSMILLTILYKILIIYKL